MESFVGRLAGGARALQGWASALTGGRGGVARPQWEGGTGWEGQRSGPAPRSPTPLRGAPSAGSVQCRDRRRAGGRAQAAGRRGGARGGPPVRSEAAPAVSRPVPVCPHSQLAVLRGAWGASPCALCAPRPPVLGGLQTRSHSLNRIPEPAVRSEGPVAMGGRGGGAVGVGLWAPGQDCRLSPFPAVRRDPRAPPGSLLRH